MAPVLVIAGIAFSLSQIRSASYGSHLRTVLHLSQSPHHYAVIIVVVVVIVVVTVIVLAVVEGRLDPTCILNLVTLPSRYVTA